MPGGFSEGVAAEARCYGVDRSEAWIPAVDRRATPDDGWFCLARGIRLALISLRRALGLHPTGLSGEPSPHAGASGTVAKRASGFLLSLASADCWSAATSLVAVSV